MLELCEDLWYQCSSFKLQASSFKIQDPQSPTTTTTKDPCFSFGQHQQSQYLVHNAKSSTFLERSTITYIIIDIIIDIFNFQLLRTLSHHLMYDDQDPQSPKTNKSTMFFGRVATTPNAYFSFGQHQQSQYLVQNAKSSTFLERSTITYIFYFNLLGTLSHQLMYDEVAHAEIL